MTTSVAILGSGGKMGFRVTKKLVDAGLLTREQRGKWAHYTVVRGAFTELRELLDLR